MTSLLRKVRLAKSAPLNVAKSDEDDEGSEDIPKEVVLQATRSNPYQWQESLEPSRPVNETARKFCV